MFRSTLYLCFSLCLLLCGLRAGLADPPPAAWTLPNGLRVVTRERHSTSLVAIDLWVRAGSREEAPNEIGSAHFLEHTLFKGTTTRGPGDVDIAIENLGGTLDAATGPDYAHFYTTIISTHLEEGLSILADVVRNATLPDAEVARERGVILDELAEHEADPSARLIDLLYAHAFSTHPYRRSPGGTSEAIQVRGRDTLAAFYRRTYQPDRCTLALAGDLTPDRAHEAARRAFGDWASANVATSAPEMVSASDPIPAVPRQVQAAGETATGRVGMAFRAPAARDAVMACAAQVTAALLDSDGSGRFAGGVLAGTDASARFTPRRDPGLFLVTAALPAASSSASAARGPAPVADLPSLENALLVAIHSLLTAPPTPAEIAVAKRRVLGHLQFDLETNAGWARALGYADLVGGDVPETFQTRLQQLTPDDLQRFVRLYLDPDHRVTVRLLPTSALTRNNL